jgi:hypothetical protein
MVARRRCPLSSGKLGRRIARRRDERGAAIFVVVMVLTMLTGVGVFAMRAASLAESASGYDRQNTQNHYVGEYGLYGAVAELSSPRRNIYYDRLKTGKEKCLATKGLPPSSTGIVPCAPIETGEVQAAVMSNFSGRPLFEPATMTSAGKVTPGSLGPGGLDGDFRVEMSDPGPVGLPVAGAQQNVQSGTVWRYQQVTLTSVGQVRPAGNAGVCNPVAAGVAGNETGRAFVVIGPILGG